MKKLLILFSLGIVACSNKEILPPDQQGGQYCFVDEKITDTNGKQNAVTITECSDKPRVEHFVKSQGIAKECRPYQLQYSIKGKVKNVKGFLCQFADGSWEAVDGRYAY